MRKIDRRIVIVVSVIFILGLAYGLMRFLIAQKEEPPVRQTIESRRFVRVEPVKYTSISSSISEKGRLSSIAEVDIVAEASGKIEAGTVTLKKGASFSKGDVLFLVYPDEAILSLKARKSQYQNILAGILPDLIIDFPEAEESFSQFFATINVGKPLPPMPEIEDSKLKIFLASRNVISEYYNIQRDELQLQRHTVRAPFNGTFIDVYMELGAFTNTGGKVARAINTDHLELEVPLKRSEASWIQKGDPVTISSEGSYTWKGKVIRKSQFVDENTQSQTIFISLPYDREQPLMAGEYLVAHFPVRPIEGAMEIPRNSVFNSDEVFVARSGRLAKERINVIKLNASTLIFNGLPEGDSVVVQQLINVSEGTLVQVDKEAASQQMQPGGPGGGPQANPAVQPGAGENKKEQSAKKARNK
ncbi:MAG: HlyD family efflux transporter periplasmic adaptor subunit [Bacteroidia bacterium]|nr:MAG: HlyD family efflux transporter periplasmic adaptor subunit [Bacteroidia bacterium]